MKILCLEGCSGTGKTTQYHLLNEEIPKMGKKHLCVVEKLYEPFKSSVENWHKFKGPKIPFTKEDIIDFAKSRYETFSKNFSQLEGKIDLLLLDRYFYTSAIYQRNSELNPKEILKININYGAPIPNLTFLFDGNPETCFERSEIRNKKTGGKHLFSTNPQKISEMREQYLNLMSRRKEVEIVDTSKSILEINNFLIERIKSLF